MNKKIVTNDTTVFASAGAFLAWSAVQLGLWFIPDFVNQGGEGLWVMGLTILFAWVGRQIKYYAVEHNKKPESS